MMESTSPNSLLHILMNVGNQFSRQMNLAVAEAWRVTFALEGDLARGLRSHHRVAIIFL